MMQEVVHVLIQLIPERHARYKNEMNGKGATSGAEVSGNVAGMHRSSENDE